MPTGIVDGQPVDAANSNPAWIAKNGDDTSQAKTSFNDQAADAPTVSGTPLFNIQRAANSIAMFTGWIINTSITTLPSWVTNYRGSGFDSLFARIKALDAAFSGTPTTGHTHDGTDGQGAPVSASKVIDLNYLRAAWQKVQVAAATGSSFDITTSMSGKTAGGTGSVAGVITAPPSNRAEIRDSSQGDQLEDTSGNKVYGRITFASSVWTLSFYIFDGGVEVPYTFSDLHNIYVYFREVFNLKNLPTIEADVGEMLSDDATNDIVDARPSQRGLTRFAAGEVPLPSGAQSVSVAFSEMFPDTNFALAPNIRNTLDAQPIFLQAIQTMKAATGFTLTFNAPTDSANYVLEYTATRYQ
jgi:hypothetical protein